MSTKALGDGFHLKFTNGRALCTDLFQAGLPFREAHHVTGRVVARAEALGCKLEAMPIDELTAIDARITPAVFDVLSIDASVASRRSYGGTAPERVREAIARARATGDKT